jgi:hypothetical protein
MQYYLYLVGFLIILGGLALLVRRAIFVSRSQPKTGRLTGWEKRLGDGNEYDLPVVEYVGRDGKVRRKTLPSSLAAFDPQIGDKVDILIEAQDDDSPLPEGFVGIWLAPLVLLLLGCAALYVAADF